MRPLIEEKHRQHRNIKNFFKRLHLVSLPHMFETKYMLDKDKHFTGSSLAVKEQGASKDNFSN